MNEQEAAQRYNELSGFQTVGLELHGNGAVLATLLRNGYYYQEIMQPLFPKVDDDTQIKLTTRSSEKLHDYIDENARGG